MVNSLLTDVTTQLLAEVTITTLVATRIYKEQLEVSVKDTGNCAIVLALAGGNSPNKHTWRNPRVQVMIYADVTRDADGFATTKDAQDKMYTIYLALDKILHFPFGDVRVWSEHRIARSLRENEPRVLWDIKSDTEVFMTSYLMTVV